MTDQKKQLIIVTGLAGAGKSITLNTFEDMGFFCIDNLPLFLGEELARHLADEGRGLERIVVTVDGRSADFFQQWSAFVQPFRCLAHVFTMLYLDAKDEVLIRRFSQMRRLHPLAGECDGLAAGIALERQRLQGVQAAADLVIDTSAFTPNDLRAKLINLFAGEGEGGSLAVRVNSFGFKRGLPPEADLVFDVRFLPNPYFEQDLRQLTGKEAAVANYVLQTKAGIEFFDLLLAQLKFLLPQYQQAGKMSLTIAFGCTGGKHRSVAVAEKIGTWLAGQGVDFRLSHRDIGME